MTNRLGQEKSPYLQQHADNPVDWYPWGEEAFARARASDRPVLVSIGYSACHWCHVMAHESFEDPTTARIMNDRFVNIKVDREERPDVDSIYMEAVQTLTGQGGWPLNVFLTPEGEPFYGGTYFPSEPRYGMPSWRQVLEAVAGAYEGRRSEVTSSAAQLTQRIHQAQEPRISAEPLTPDILQAAYAGAKSQLDWENGGFGGAPKFPQPLALEFMLRMSRRLADEDGLRFVDLTLAKMAAGGIFDHLGGGFHRYTVDGQWVVPHFEKMLYDNALLSRVYLQAFQLTGDHRFRTVVEQTLDYLLRDMRSPEGGFCSAEDADSEGVEGKYYVWTPDDLSAVLDRDVVRVMALHYGVREGGNFEGATILTLSRSVEEIAHQIGATSAKVERMIEAGRRALLEARFRRVPPGKDTKILASWNALAIRALAEAGRTLGRVDYMEAAERAAGFILDAFFPRGVLVRSFNDGPSEIPAFLEDYAFLVEALLSLYEASFRTEYFLRARTLAGEMVERFWDEERRAFFDTVPGEHELVVRPRTVFDNPIPSGTAAAAFGLLRLEAHTGDTRYARHAAAAFHAARDLLPRAPQGFGYLLSALDFYLSSPLQVAIVGDREGDDTVRLVQPVFDRYLPNKVVAVGGEGDVPLLAGRSRNEGRATAYVCEHFSCRMPVTDERDLELQLQSLDASASE